LYIVHPAGGFVFMYYGLAEFLPNVPIIGFQDPALVKAGVKPFKTVPAAAAAYTEKLLERQPSGPYRIAGWSMGGQIAFEMARNLSLSGKDVTLIIIDSWFTEDYKRLRFWANNLKNSIPFIRDKLSGLKHKLKRTHIHKHSAHEAPPGTTIPAGTSANASIRPIKIKLQGPDMNVLRLFRTLHSHMKGLAKYRPEPCPPFPVFLIRAEDTTKINDVHNNGHDPTAGWLSVCPNIIIGDVPGDHFSMMHGENVKYVGQQLHEIWTHGSLIPKIVAQE